MDPITITFPGFKNLYQDEFSGRVPLSTDYVIVFPVNSSDKKFSRSIYSPAMTNGRASSEDIDQALSLFEIALSRGISYSDVVKGIKSFCWRFVLPFIILLCLEGNYMLRRSETVWLCFVAYCFTGIYYLFANKNAQTKRTKADTERIIDLVQPSYLKKGLRWRIPEGSYGWIELIKEYRENEVINAPPAQVHETKLNSQYEPPQSVPETTTATGYPPINSDGLPPK